MNAVDTNVLVLAHRAGDARQPAAMRLMRSLIDGDAPWAIPWPCVHEFISVMTNRSVFKKPASVADAVALIESWQHSPLRLIGEGSQHLRRLAELLSASGRTGGAVHDARIAAICIEHRVDVMYSHDRDFRDFRRLNVIDPFRVTS